MSSIPADKDRSNLSLQDAEPSPIAREAANSGAEWPRLLARVVEGIVRAELHQFEENVMAFLHSAVADADATFIWIRARIIGREQTDQDPFPIDHGNPPSAVLPH